MMSKSGVSMYCIPLTLFINLLPSRLLHHPGMHRISLRSACARGGV